MNSIKTTGTEHQDKCVDYPVGQMFIENTILKI